MQGRDVRLKNVAVRFGDVTAVAPLDLVVRSGEFFGVLGPSGSGKTSLLRAIGGFVPVGEGRIHIGGADVTDLPAELRPTAIIFQNLALFPLMTVADNIGFGLEARGMPAGQRRAKVKALIDLVALEGLEGRYPHQLSGGQRQRVAVARALAVEPSVLLLDEPLSALDLKLRHRMRDELRAIQRRTGITFIYITHDQSEVLAMADRVAVMNEGRIEQIETPDNLYAQPATAFVASFIGEQNRLSGRVQSISGALASVETGLGLIAARQTQPLEVGQPVEVMIRPERVVVQDDPTLANRVDAELVSRRLEGATVSYLFQCRGVSLMAQVANIGSTASLLASVHRIGFRADDAQIFPARSSGAAPGRVGHG
jgi:spermidine/putrescine transport system ATP-binding protein